MPVAFHAIALIIGLFVQALASPLAGAWLFFYIFGCVGLVYNHKYPPHHPALWYVSLAWLITLGASTFLISPVFKASATMWILAIMPSLVLCMRREHLKSYFWAFGGIIFVYACGLVFQKFTHMTYSTFDYDGRIAWPLIDPNNAAAVVNTALIPCFWLALFRSPRWWWATALFSLAMYATGSKAGFCAGGLCMLIIAVSRFGPGFLLCSIITGAAAVLGVFAYIPESDLAMIESFETRTPIWWCAWKILQEHFIRGTGLGTFGLYRIQEGTTVYIPPTYAHNDLLQFAVEMGIPASTVFLTIFVVVACKTRRRNLAPACVLLAVFLQAMVEFQFYLPCISLICGLALAAHMLLPETREKGIIRQREFRI
jgi:O-antigen ligase